MVNKGIQVWLKENLKATKFNGGTLVPIVDDGSAWGSLTSPGYCWYNNDISLKNPYGAIYYWNTANTSILKFFKTN